MKCLIISDIHLKPQLFDRAEEILAARPDITTTVQLGDLTDDWGQEFNVALYTRTLNRAIKFQKDHPNTLWCLGNHDLGYLQPNLGWSESGHSRIAETDMLPLLRKLPLRVAHIVDNTIFSHAGLLTSWVARLLPEGMFDPEWVDLSLLVNSATPPDLWQNDSPIWVRPQGRDKCSKLDRCHLYPGYYQVVGHTPVSAVQVEYDGHLISTDTHSTYSDGSPIGDGSFCVVDTLTGEWEVIE